MKRLLVVTLAACTSQASVGSDVDGSANDATLVDASAVADSYVADSADASPVDPTGSYTCVLRAGKNGCGFGAWTEGSIGTVQAVVTVDDAGTGYSLTVQGFAAATFSLVTGTNVLRGTVTTNRLDFSVKGTLASTVGACTFAYDARIVGTLDGDKLDATVTYTRALPADPQCAALACTSEEQLTGYRDTTVDF